MTQITDFTLSPNLWGGEIDLSFSYSDSFDEGDGIQLIVIRKKGSAVSNTEITDAKNALIANTYGALVENSTPRPPSDKTLRYLAGIPTSAEKLHDTNLIVNGLVYHYASFLYDPSDTDKFSTTKTANATASQSVKINVRDPKDDVISTVRFVVPQIGTANGDKLKEGEHYEVFSAYPILKTKGMHFVVSFVNAANPSPLIDNVSETELPNVQKGFNDREVVRLEWRIPNNSERRDFITKVMKSLRPNIFDHLLKVKKYKSVSIIMNQDEVEDDPFQGAIMYIGSMNVTLESEMTWISESPSALKGNLTIGKTVVVNT